MLLYFEEKQRVTKVICNSVIDRWYSTIIYQWIHYKVWQKLSKIFYSVDNSQYWRYQKCSWWL